MAKTFLDLPTEIRKHVYYHVVPSSRLCTRSFLDLDHELGDRVDKAIPLPLFLVSKQVYAESAPIFYAKAVLEISVPQLPTFMLHALSGPKCPPFDLTRQLELELEFLPHQHRRAIQRADIFSDQRDVVNDEAYEATLKWLLTHTSVKQIYISQRVVARTRKSRVVVDEKILPQSLGRVLSRTVYVYRTSSLPPWEKNVMRQKARTKFTDLDDFWLVTYFYSQRGRNISLQADPRSNIKDSDSAIEVNRSRAVGAIFDAYRKTDRVWQRLNEQRDISSALPVSSNDPQLYQILFVLP